MFAPPVSVGGAAYDGAPPYEESTPMRPGHPSAPVSVRTIVGRWEVPDGADRAGGVGVAS